MSVKFFKCQACGKIVEELVPSKCPTLCCGKEMVELKANTTDAAQEKHVPVVTVDGDKVTVTVGSVIHPSEDDHYIQFIAIETEKSVQKKMLKPGEKPEAAFLLNGEKLVAAYELCNKHGLWKKDL